MELVATPDGYPAPTDEYSNDINEKLSVSANDFLKAEEIERHLRQRHIIEFGSKKYFARGETAATIPFHFRPQPSFNRQFDLLINDLKEYESKKIQYLSFCGESKTTGKIAQHFHGPEGRYTGYSHPSIHS